jgi:adhesin transport system outer membrane protein
MLLSISRKIRIKTKLLLSASLLGLGAQSALATENEQLTLSDFVTDSVDAHPRVREQMHIFRQIMQDEVIARSGWHPSVDLLATVSKVDGERPNQNATREEEYTSDNIELSLTQNLFHGFDTKYAMRQAEARARSALFQLYDSADNIALEAIQAYIEVLKQRRLLFLAEKNLKSHEETLSKITKRSNSGAGRRSQLEQTEGRVARAGASLIAQQNNLQDALTKLHEILGRYVNANDLVEPSLPILPDGSIEELIDLALSQHPAMKVASYNIDAALSDKRRSEKHLYPKIDLKLAKQVGNDLNGIIGETDQTSISLNLQYNFYAGGANRAEEHKKVSVVHEKQEFSHRARRQIINTLRLAWTADQSLTEQLKFLSKHVVKSQETMRSYQEEFFIGQRDLIDLLDAKNELNAAQNRYAQAYFDAMAARYRIHEGLGQLFSAMNLNMTVEDNDFRLFKIQANGVDELPINQDRDTDNELDDTDHCDNSKDKTQVDDYGCEVILSASAPKIKIDPAMELKQEQQAVTLKAVDDEFELNQNGVMEITAKMLTSNDTSADKESLEILSFTQPDHGKLALKVNNTRGKDLIYRAPEDFVGLDKFGYTLIDSGNLSSTGTVKINIPAESDIDLTKVHYVNFRFSKTELTDASRAKVDRILEKLKANLSVMVSIYAYTDSVGSESYNLKLSQKRSQAMRDLLIQAGIADTRIRVYGMGESNPIADNNTKEGQAINRRGEFHFVVNPE